MELPSSWTAALAAINLVDVLLILVVLLGAVSGWHRGFLAGSLQLLRLAASLVLAFVGYRYPAAWLEAQAPGLGVWTMPLSFLASFLLAYLVLSALVGAIVRAVPRRVHAHPGNQLLGVAPGLVNGLINATVLAVLLLTLPLLDSLTMLARDSALASRLSGPAEWLESKLQPIFDPAIRRSMQALTVRPESKTVVKLPFAVASPTPRPDLEARMLEMVNAERATQGLKPLQPDPELTQVARAHSRDMFARGYFSHVSPERKDPFDRMREAKVRYLAAGENLALARTLPAAHQGLLNSPGHRANLLRPQFQRAGIGVLDGGTHGLMITQNFRN